MTSPPVENFPGNSLAVPRRAVPCRAVPCRAVPCCAVPRRAAPRRAVPRSSAMSQQFQVLRCFSCQTFQVQQVKKSSRWRCKLCGEKQTLLKEFGRGSGADCRRHVQKLNAMRGAMLDQLRENRQVEPDSGRTLR
uniref:MRN complex-interacting protein N-terminal domain-containing protein n=1 Tax=Myripristis murdjan TaxID=586833 RepID=A0A667Z022_9TELE